MNPPQNIYALISFSQSHIDAWDRVRQKDKEYSEMVKGMTKDERKEFGIKWRAENKHTPEQGINYGKAYRGCFLNRADLVEIIDSQRDAWGLCEGYYEYLLIEKRTIGEIDDTCWGDDGGETWYKFTQVDEGEWRYLEIPKPECFKQTFNFL